MSYSSLGDIRAATDWNTLRALSDRDNDGKPDTGVINAAISAGDAIIDGSLAAKYTVPFTTIPNTIKFMSVAFAKWNLLNGTLQPEGFADNLRPAWEADYKRFTVMLNNYATGTAKLPSATPTGVRPEISAGLAGGDVEKQFTMSRANVGGDTITTDEAGSMDTW